MACARRDVGMTSSARKASAPPLKNFEYESEGADVAIKMPNLSQMTGLFPSEKVPNPFEKKPPFGDFLRTFHVESTRKVLT